jgi:hypothetical protein
MGRGRSSPEISVTVHQRARHKHSCRKPKRRSIEYAVLWPVRKRIESLSWIRSRRNATLVSADTCRVLASLQ